jgi:hypothetical protein
MPAIGVACFGKRRSKDGSASASAQASRIVERVDAAEKAGSPP